MPLQDDIYLAANGVTVSTGASDGTKRLVSSIAISSAQVGTAATRAALLGVTQA
jgi:hypothetical protein